MMESHDLELRVLLPLLQWQATLRAGSSVDELGAALTAAVRQVPGVVDACCCFAQRPLTGTHASAVVPPLPPCLSAAAEGEARPGCCLPCPYSDRGFRHVGFAEGSGAAGALLLKVAHPERFAAYQTSVASVVHSAGLWLALADQARGTATAPQLLVAAPSRDAATGAERHQMQVAIEREKTFNDALIHSVPGMLYLYDDQGALVKWNRRHEELTGYSSEELAKMRLLDWYKGDTAAQTLIAARVQDALRTGFADAEANLRCKDGTLIPMYFTAVPLAIEGKTYFTGIGIEMSAQKRAEAEKASLAAQLAQAQKMESVGRLAGGVAHDFNNMLAIIFLSVELIKMTITEPGPVLDNLDQIEQAATRSRDITRKLLTFSRKQMIEPRHVDLNALLTESQKTLARLIGEDIELRFFPQPNLRPILIDPSQIDQVLMNLAVNARDAMPHGGKLTLEVANVTFDAAYCEEHVDFKPGDYVQLAVTDDGVGMDESVLAHLFEPFYTTKGVGKGTGLGLAMVYGVVQQNNGFVSVYSEVGHGTTFKLYFPAVAGDALLHAASAAEPWVHGTGKILLVEDDASLCQMTRAALERLGYLVTSAGTPAEALALVRQATTPFALLITDVVMPVMNGKQLSEQLLALQPTMKVLFVSGYAENAIIHRGVLDSGLHFLQKPFSLRMLSAKVQALLSPSANANEHV